MTLTDEVKEQITDALDRAEEMRTLLMACIKEPTAEKLRKANYHYTQRIVFLTKAMGFVEQLYKQNNKDLKDIVRLENASI